MSHPTTYPTPEEFSRDVAAERAAALKKRTEKTTQPMQLVILESPFAGDVEANLTYARACMRDCFLRNEAPWASHLLYPQPGILDDTNPEERRLGIEAGLLWGAHAAKTVVYTDRGISRGMTQGIERAKSEGREVEYRSLETPQP